MCRNADSFRLSQRILGSDIRPFDRSLVFRIAEYAKGRKLTAIDYPVVEEIVEAHSGSDFRLKDLVTAIATSDLLTHR